MNNTEDDLAFGAPPPQHAFVLPMPVHHPDTDENRAKPTAGADFGAGGA
jgi:hypothetical protein